MIECIFNIYFFIFISSKSTLQVVNISYYFILFFQTTNFKTNIKEYICIFY